MHSKNAKAPTAAERRRMAKIVEIGCICCIHDGHEPIQPGEVHHLLDCGRRIGHRFTVSACNWHHRGVPPAGFNQKQATAFIGPSLALDGKAFHAHYGTDGDLLAFQEFLLKDMANA